ncbi:MAG: 3'-5' exonuclease [Planctomycetaceae bacterium]|jgi:DNA polymerase III epsilon subunit-like protein|nr:3'-5' exonuclease [Planctomycetaceae bacterium]
MSGIWDLKIAKTLIAVIDFETTGLTAGIDRVVEATAMRIEPDSSEIKVVFDSLINPQRSVGATYIHGISDDDVIDAPTFKEILPDFLGSISGCVVTSYNIYFDIKFLESEMRLAGLKLNIPHFCIMYLRNALMGGSRVKLENACNENVIALENSHHSFHDTLMASQLLYRYLSIVQNQRNNASFRDLSSIKKDYKFWDSFDYSLIPDPLQFGLRVSNKVKSRSLAKEHLPIQYDTDNEVIKQKEAIQLLSNATEIQNKIKNETENIKIKKNLVSYLETIQIIVSDYIADDQELELVKAEQKRLNLSKEQIRAVHAKVFSSIMANFIDDEFLDDEETKKLQKIWKCLHSLGWAPGMFNVQ